MKKVILLLTTLFFIIFDIVAQSIDYVDFNQEGKTVVINYKLSGCISCDIAVFVSFDGGKTFNKEPLSAVSGDVGKEITAGKKRIVWDVFKEYPMGINANVDLAFMVRITGNIKKPKSLLKNKRLNWFVRVGGNIHRGNILYDEKYETLFNTGSSKDNLPAKFGYNFSLGFMLPVKDKRIYWGMDMGLSCELKISYNKTGNLKYDEDLRPALEVSPFVGWIIGDGSVKFDPHLGLFLEYGFGIGFNAGVNAGMGVWFGHFNIDIIYSQLFISNDCEYYYDHYYDEEMQEYHYGDTGSMSYLPCVVQIRLGYMFGKNK